MPVSRARLASRVCPPTSTYDDITAKGSRYANRATNVSKADFEANLIAQGATRSVSADGRAIILQQADGSRYVLRDYAKSTGGPTAEFFKAGSNKIDLKIRLDVKTP